MKLHCFCTSAKRRPGNTYLPKSKSHLPGLCFIFVQNWCNFIALLELIQFFLSHYFSIFLPIMWDLTDNSKKKMLLLLSENFLNDSVQFFSSYQHKWGFVHFCIQQMLQKVTEKDHLGKIFRTMEVWHWLLVRVNFMKKNRRKFKPFVFQKQTLKTLNHTLNHLDYLPTAKSL